MNFLQHACEKQVFPVSIDLCLFYDIHLHRFFMILTKIIDFDRPNDQSAFYKFTNSKFEDNIICEYATIATTNWLMSGQSCGICFYRNVVAFILRD